jgi:hypothetical protein
MCWFFWCRPGGLSSCPEVFWVSELLVSLVVVVDQLVVVNRREVVTSRAK